MLGHVLWEQARGRTDAHATVRGDDAPPPLDPERTVTGVRADDPDSVERALRAVRPDVVVNCIGAVKQLRSMPAADMVRVNALFPHELAAVSAAHGARLVHL